MTSPFVDHFLGPLAFSRPSTPTETQLKNTPLADTDAKKALQSLLLNVNNKQLSPAVVNETIDTLRHLEQTAKAVVANDAGEDADENALKKAIINRLVIGLYAECLEVCISQATDAENEAEWWADVERSRRNVAWYLLQSFPVRIFNLGSVIVQGFHNHNLPLTLSNFTHTSLKQLFPSTDSLRPSALTKALFPHLHHQSFSLASSTIMFSSITRDGAESSLFRRFLFNLNTVTTLPIELTRQECTWKRRELERLRNARAEALGRLSQLRGNLLSVVKDQPWDMRNLVHALACVVEGESQPVCSPVHNPLHGEISSPLPEVKQLSTIVFTQKYSRDGLFTTRHLRRPSRAILLWPRFLLLPPLCIYALRSVYTSRATLAQVAGDARDTVEGFIKGWLIEPIKDVLHTIRAGGEDGVIVRKEGVAADFDSLERMTLALARDELHYKPEQLAALSAQIKLGDLTPVLEIYEEDIKRPLKSALTGTLLRSVFIQVQKAKVDIDQALAGIDRLLKSQELTFAFVGVAPAFSIVYLLGGSFLRLLNGGRGLGKYGGKRKIGSVWATMRRTERLLISQPGSSQNELELPNGSIPPLTAGLLLLSVAHLRAYAETCLPVRSRLREGFLEDVGDLENPDLGRAEKMRVVERMWRCWGDVLGWKRAGGGDASLG